MSNRLFQSVVHQMSESIDRIIGVVDDSATVIAASDSQKVGACNKLVYKKLTKSSDTFVVGSYTYQIFEPENGPECAVFVEGTDETALMLVKVLATAFSNIKQYYDEKYDRTNFIKNVSLDNILPGDICAKARELHFRTDATRVALLIRILSNNDVSAYEVVQSLFPDKQNDFIFTIGENEIVLIKEIRVEIDTKDLEKLARSIIDTLSGEFYTRATVGIGSCVTAMNDLARSFKEAQVALEVSKVFDTDKMIVSYDRLGIARLIYQLPTTLCETFLREVFKRGPIESLDHETLFTIQKFFEYNLNVSETSRRLFIHRNTLVYRLERIRKLTGLDLREFDHAIVFKIALMVKKYLVAKPSKL